MSQAPALLTFDCTGTLFEPRAGTSVGALYRAALVEAAAGGPHAAAAAALDVDALNAAFSGAYKVAEVRRPCFGAGAISSEDWWLEVVRATLERGGTATGVVEALLPDAFEVLYHRVFVSSESWTLKPGAMETLRTLCDWRDAQPADERTALGVVSNWDERLPLLLDELGVSRYLDAVVTSREVGAQKPAAEIFHCARAATGVDADARAVHVGDTFSRDVVGAVAASWEAIFLTSEEQLAKRTAADLAQIEAVPHTAILGLREIPQALGLDLSPGLQARR